MLISENSTSAEGEIYWMALMTGVLQFIIICVLIKISLLLHNIFCYIFYEIIKKKIVISLMKLLFFSSLQLTPGGVFINKS